MPTVSDLGVLVKQKFPGTYDDLPDSTLGRLTKQKYPDAYQDFTGDVPPEPPASEPNLLQKGINYLPDVGGAVGGLAGKAVGGVLGGPAAYPAGIAGASLLGGAGEAAKQALQGQGLNFGQIAQQGGLQGAYEAGGGLLGKLGGVAARGVMGRVLPRASREVVDEAIKQGVRIGKPTVVEKVVTQGAGAQKARLLRQAAAAETKDLLKKAKAARIRITLAEIAEPAIRMQEEALERQLTQLERTAVIETVRNRAEAMFKSNLISGAVSVGPRLNPTQTKLLKRVAQNMSSQARKGAALGIQVTGNPKLDHAVALGTREALENRISDRVAQQLTGRGVGMAGREAATKRLIELERAVAKREASSAATQIPITGPLRLLGSATPTVGLPPELASSLALLLAGSEPYLRQAPRLVGAVADQ